MGKDSEPLGGNCPCKTCLVIPIAKLSQIFVKHTGFSNDFNSFYPALFVRFFNRFKTKHGAPSLSNSLI